MLIFGTTKNSQEKKLEDKIKKLEEENKLLKMKISEFKKEENQNEILQEKKLENSVWHQMETFYSEEIKLSHEKCFAGKWATLAEKKNVEVLKPEFIGRILAQGWSLYTDSMEFISCKNCSACRPIRIDIKKPFSKSEEKILKPFLEKGKIICSEDFTEEHENLYARFVQKRFGNECTRSLQDIFKSNIKDTKKYIVSLYDENKKLQAFLFFSVYKYGAAFAFTHVYELENEYKSLGKAVILGTIDCLRKAKYDFPYLYLGHTKGKNYIYKTKFNGSEILTIDGWVSCRELEKHNKLDILMEIPKEKIDNPEEIKTSEETDAVEKETENLVKPLQEDLKINPISFDK